MKKFIFLLFFAVPLQAQQTLSYPATATSLSGVNNPWITPSNAELEDGISSTATLNVSRSPTNILAATGFGFSLPINAHIDGIVVEIKKMNVDNIVTDNSVILYNSDGSSNSSDRADTVTAWPIGLTWVSYGSSKDTWGKIWTSNDINSPNFGVGINANTSGSNTDASIDSIRITVYYFITDIFNGRIYNGRFP